jgi:methionyl-tRNA formyltransferase
VRAFDPWPVARTRVSGEDLLIWKSAVVPEAALATPIGEPGTIVQIAPTPVVKCGNGYLALVELQAPGRRRTGASDFMRGRRAKVGLRLGE